MRSLRYLLMIGAALAYSTPSLAENPPTKDQILANGAKQIGDDDLKDIFINKTITHQYISTGQLLTIFFRGDGTRYYLTKQAIWTGPWEIRDNARCEEVSTGAEICFTAYRMPSNDIIICDPRDSGVCKWRISNIRTGDPDGLGKK